MIRFSPAKINIGLRITSRRSDGFHNLQSLMVPIGLRDILEVLPARKGEADFQFTESGTPSGSSPGDNLCEKAFRLLSGHCPLPPVRIHLHKQIPVGAGLGGGSSNASHTLLALNGMSTTPLPMEGLYELAAELGSDCPFFLQDKAMMMEGRGEILYPHPLNLQGMELVLIFPSIHSSTAEAYSAVTPRQPETHLGLLLEKPINTWKDLIVNDFEEGIFRIYPEIGKIKDRLYHAGAIYAAMSGSGSSVYGIFRKTPVLEPELKSQLVWQGRL